MQIISRNEAQALGKKRFYTGELCKHGHNAERFVSSGGCVECVNRSTPHKRAESDNVRMPDEPFIFEGVSCTREESGAALRYVQHMKWHVAALQALQANPALMAQFKATPPTEAELAAARALLDNYGRSAVKTGTDLTDPAQLAARNARLKQP